MVIATGLTSEPSRPRFPGEEKFDRELFHAKELKHRASAVENAEEVVVLGGNKSAWDTCFWAATTGAHVHMVMRPSGGGPSFLWPVRFSPLQISIQRVASTRIFTLFDPCIWSEKTGAVGWVRYFLHQTFLGRKLVSKFWSILAGFAQSVHRYDEHPETKKLKPWINPLWMGNSLSIHNYTSPWFDLVRQGKITIHVADVTSLSEGVVHLSNNLDLEVDALVCCTGWNTRPPLKFLPEDLASKLGLTDSADPVLVENARSEVFASIPIMRAGPKRTLPTGAAEPQVLDASRDTKNSTRYLLYRFLVSPYEKSFAQRNIAFIGSHLALNAIMIAQLQALWVTAFFMNEIPNLKPGTVNHGKVWYETVLHNEYTRMRHPHGVGGAGEKCPDLAFDCLSYMDLLGQDLGLTKWRKSGIWSETFYRYVPSDYTGITQEWLSKRK